MNESPTYTVFLILYIIVSTFYHLSLGVIIIEYWFGPYQWTERLRKWIKER